MYIYNVYNIINKRKVSQVPVSSLGQLHKPLRKCVGLHV